MLAGLRLASGVGHTQVAATEWVRFVVLCMRLVCDSTSNHFRTVGGRRLKVCVHACVVVLSAFTPLNLLIDRFCSPVFCKPLSPAHSLRRSTMEKSKRIARSLGDRLHARSRSINARLRRSPTPDPEQDNQRSGPPGKPADRSSAAAYPPGHSVVAAPPPADCDKSHPNTDVTAVIA